MKIEDLIENIRMISTGYPAIEKVWLFGSWAREDAMPNSDLDLAVSELPFHSKAWLQFLDKLDALPTLCTIDIHNLEWTSASSTFNFRVY